MKRSLFLTGFGILGFFLMSWGSPLWPQETPAKKKAKAHEIEGFWTQGHSETDGDSTPSMMNPARTRVGQMSGPGGIWTDTGPIFWKFSKEEVELGFPQFWNHYQLNPGGKKGAIDMIPLDKKGKKIEKVKLKGIYFLKENILIICYSYDPGEPRPKAFTTSAQSKSRLVILRRGKLK